MTKKDKIYSFAAGAMITGASGAYATSLLFNAAALSTAGVAFAAAAAVTNLAVCGACLYAAARTVRSEKPAQTAKPDNPAP